MANYLQRLVQKAKENISIPNYVDSAGTLLGLPEFGLSERLNKGNSTINTAFPQSQGTQGDTQSTEPFGPVPGEEDYFSNALGSIPSTGSGGGGGTSGGSHYVQYNGQVFNLADPGQTLSYRQAVAANLSQQREQLLSQANNQYTIQSKDAADKMARALSDLDIQISDNQKAAKDFVNSHLKTVSQFNNDKSQGDVQRGQNFASLSPNAFQSSQATSQQFANDRYVEGLGDLQKNAQDTVGLGYIEDPNDPTKLDQNSSFGRQMGQLNQGKGDVNTSYQNYLRDLSSGVADYTNQVNQGYTQGLDDKANQIGVGGFQGQNPFSYNMQSFGPVQANQVDLSKYTPYTNTQSLTSVPQSQSGGYKAVNTTNPFANQSVTDSYLGRTNTTLDNGQSDYLKKYLLGKSY